MRLQERLMREYQEWRITNYDQVMAAIQGQVVEERRADYLDYEIRALQDQKRKLMCSFPMVCSTALLFHSETLWDEKEKVLAEIDVLEKEIRARDEARIDALIKKEELKKLCEQLRRDKFSSPDFGRLGSPRP